MEVGLAVALVGLVTRQYGVSSYQPAPDSKTIRRASCPPFLPGLAGPQGLWRARRVSPPRSELLAEHIVVGYFGDAGAVAGNVKRLHCLELILGRYAP